MEYISFTQLLFALLAVLGMIYIEVVNDRNKRHYENYNNLRYNLLKIAERYNDSRTLKEMILESATFEALEENFNRINNPKTIDENNQYYKAAKNELQAHKNIRNSEINQKILFWLPFLLIIVFSLLIIWLPDLKRISLFAFPNKIKIAETIVMIVSFTCIFILANYPYSGISIGKNKDANTR